MFVNELLLFRHSIDEDAEVVETPDESTNLEAVDEMNRDVDIFLARLIQKRILEKILRDFGFGFFFWHWSDLPKILEAMLDPIYIRHSFEPSDLPLCKMSRRELNPLDRFGFGRFSID